MSSFCCGSDPRKLLPPTLSPSPILLISVDAKTTFGGCRGEGNGERKVNTLGVHSSRSSSQMLCYNLKSKRPQAALQSVKPHDGLSEDPSLEMKNSAPFANSPDHCHETLPVPGAPHRLFPAILLPLVGRRRVSPVCATSRQAPLPARLLTAHPARPHVLLQSEAPQVRGSGAQAHPKPRPHWWQHQAGWDSSGVSQLL